MLSLVVLMFSLPSSCSAPLGRVPKRRAPDRGGASGALSSAADLVRTAAELLQLTTPAHVYSMRTDGAYEQLIDYLWTGDYSSAAGRFTDANPSLVSLFETQSLDDMAPRPDNLRRGERGLGVSFFRRFEGVFRALFRARSQTNVPFETAALSVMFLQYRVPHIAWNAAAQLSRAVMTQYWTEELCEAALARDRRNGTPWRQMEAGMQDYRDYVERKVADLCPWHKWV